MISKYLYDYWKEAIKQKLMPNNSDSEFEYHYKMSVVINTYDVCIDVLAYQSR